MTPARQPQVVDGADLKAIEDYIYSTMNHTREWELAENAYQRILTTRPHTSPPAPGFDLESFNAGQLSIAEKIPAIQAEAAKAEREKVLDVMKVEAIDWLNRVSIHGTSGERCIVGSWLATIESLRTQQEEQP